MELPVEYGVAWAGSYRSANGNTTTCFFMNLLWYFCVASYCPSVAAHSGWGWTSTSFRMSQAFLCDVTCLESWEFLEGTSVFRVLTDGRLVHGWLVKGPIIRKDANFRNGFAYCVGPGRAHTGPYGPIRAYMGPYGLSWAQKPEKIHEKSPL